MEKVKNIYYEDNDNDCYHTGLYIETESGKIYRHQDTSSIIPFERVKNLPHN